MDYWFVVLLGIAVWRLTRLLWTEKGPKDILARGRAFLATKQKGIGGLYDLVSCFYCLSIWVSMIFSLFISRDIGSFFANTLILSGISVIIQELLYKNK